MGKQNVKKGSMSEFKGQSLEINRVVEPISQNVVITTHGKRSHFGKNNIDLHLHLN